MKRIPAFWHVRDAVAMSEMVGKWAMLQAEEWHLTEGAGMNELVAGAMVQEVWRTHHCSCAPCFNRSKSLSNSLCLRMRCNKHTVMLDPT
jgi:hypothetical protein